VPVGAAYPIDDYKAALERVAAGAPGKTLLVFGDVD